MNERPGAWAVLKLLVCMLDDNELAAVESTLEDEYPPECRAALATVRDEIEAEIAAYNGGYK